MISPAQAAAWRKATEILICGLVLALVVYDVLAETHGGVDATISQVIYDTASKNPWIALLSGILIGHWFWR